jgi:hypothetical protein
MADIVKYLSELLAASGVWWCAAIVGAFIAGVGEKAYPNEGGKHPAALAAVAGVVSVITPFLLFLHAFWAIAALNSVANIEFLQLVQAAIGNAADWALLAVMAALVIAPALAGVAVAAATPPLGKLLYFAAPYAHIGVFALTVYATHANVLAVIDAVLHRPS